MSEAIDFTSLAKSQGFESEREMFQKLYPRLSLRRLSNHLGVGVSVVRYRLATYGIPVEKRGGPNNRGNRDLRKASNEELQTGKIVELCVKYGVCPSTIFRERRLRKSHEKVEAGDKEDAKDISSQRDGHSNNSGEAGHGEPPSTLHLRKD